MQTSNKQNPEFEIYRQLLIKERRFEGVQGWILTILGAVCTVLSVALLLSSFQRILASSPLVITVVFALMLSFLVACGLGVSILRKVSTSPTTQEIAHARRFHRSRLLQQAQGKVPWGYRRSGRIVLTALGVLLLAMAGLTLDVFGLQAWDAWMEAVFGLLLVLYTLLVIPSERRRLPRESAQLLANALVAGEVTEGVPLDQKEF